jgi:hypothetical protein
VRSVLAAAGFPAPREVIDWFTWHNGSLVPHASGFYTAPPTYLPLALEAAVREYDIRREGAHQLAADIVGAGLPERENPDFHWEPTWFHIALAGAQALTVELISGSETCRVYTIDPWESGDDTFRDLAAPTLTDAVRTWLEWFEHYDWTWSAETEGWENDFAALPLEVRTSKLM